MFLIRYSESNFVDAEKISWIGMEEGFIQFTVVGETGGYYSVEKCFADAFLNHLQAINNNTENVQTFYRQQEQRLETSGINS